MPRYITTIGLEVHVQLKTRSKMFCGCATGFGAEPNTNVCPVCLGYPGALPVMNEEALKMTALTGLMLGCAVPDICKFDRKNYFYPDMPKNYQITQFDQPICVGGGVPLHEFAYPKDAQKSIAAPGKVVGLTRIHLEEDVAKSSHFEANSGIDFNRAGTPLMEIVSEPELDSPEEAFAYLTSLQQILRTPDKNGRIISDADMEKGQLRCDCNISLRPEGQKELGTKIEIKNMNSISAVRRALAYEIERQTAALDRGEKLRQSTRGWDDDAGQTRHQRDKEDAHDYRYFPDPDLLPVDTRVFMDEVRARRPELPDEKRDRLVTEYGITPYDASVISNYYPVSGYYDTLVDGGLKQAESFPFPIPPPAMSSLPKIAANYVTNNLLGALSASGIAPSELNNPDFKLPPHHLSELILYQVSGQISPSQAKNVFIDAYETGKPPAEIIKEKGMEQMSDTGALEALCQQAIDASPKAVAEYKAGKVAAINAIKGQVMKLSQGKANPGVVNELLTKLLA